MKGERKIIPRQATSRQPCCPQLRTQPPRLFLLQQEPLQKGIPIGLGNQLLSRDARWWWWYWLWWMLGSIEQTWSSYLCAHSLRHFISSPSQVQSPFWLWHASCTPILVQWVVICQCTSCRLSGYQIVLCPWYVNAKDYIDRFGVQFPEEGWKRFVRRIWCLLIPTPSLNMRQENWRKVTRRNWPLHLGKTSFFFTEPLSMAGFQNSTACVAFGIRQDSKETMDTMGIKENQRSRVYL